jgi:RNA polymerase sigma-70 factor (ECF subfamily)
MDADPDLVLLQALQQGGNDAAKSFLRRFRDSVYRYSRSLLNDRDEAEDATQDVFELILSGKASVRDVEHVRPWLFQVTRNRCLMMLRAGKRAPALESSDGLWDGKSPYELAVDADIGAAIRQAVGRLKSDYREVVILREYEDLTYDEIAHTIGMPVSTVKFRLYKAREALASLLAYLEHER